MSNDNELPSLRDRVIAWLSENQYTRASFERLISNVVGVSTYEDLRQMVHDNQDVFRSAIIKGGYEGLALRNSADEPITLEEAFKALSSQVESSISSPIPDHDIIHETHPVGETHHPSNAVYPAEGTWGDLSTEEYREYTFRNNQVVRVNNPLQLQVGGFIEGRIGGPAHFIAASDGMGHHIPAGWLHLAWKTKAGKEIFNF